MNVAVIGSGHVGLVAAACFADMGHRVVCVDNDEEKTRRLCEGEVPIHEEHLPLLIARHLGKGLTFSTDLPEAVAESEVIFIAVGTPMSGSGKADLTYVEGVARDIAMAVRHTNGFRLVVEKSTVPVCTCDWIARAMVLNGASAEHFEVASNPEFLREGTAVSDFLYPDRIVFGCESEKAAAMLRELYRPLIDGQYAAQASAIAKPPRAAARPQIVAVKTKSAELIKHASNAFLAMKISFINAVANVCEAVGADINEVREGVGTDTRIGDKFLHAGIGYGGSCFPKDLAAFGVVARESGYDFRLLDEVVRINEEQRARFLKKVRDALWTLRGKKLAVLGLTFKGGTEDVRDSPALAVIRQLLDEGAEVKAYDPAGAEGAQRELSSGKLHIVESWKAACRDADAVLVLTDWKEFAQLDLDELREALRYPIMIDGRNLFDPAVMAKKKFLYYSVGRQKVEAASGAVVVR